MKQYPFPRWLRVASFRFAALYVAVFAVSAFALGSTLFLLARSVMQKQLMARLENEVSLLKDEYQSYGLAHLIGRIGDHRRGVTFRYLVESPSGARLAGDMPLPAALKPGWTTINLPDTSDDPGGREEARILVTDLGGGLLLAVGHDQEQIEELEEAVASALLWTVGIAGALGIVGGALISNAFLQRVDAITRTAEAIVEGDLAQRVPTCGTGDDFDRLAGTLNRMLDRIALLMDSLRQVSSDIAHDLRTPLTRLHQRLEEALSHARSTPEYEESINAALAETQGLLDTFSALLRIAQVEGGSPQSRFGSVNLAALTETVVDAYRPDAEERGYILISTVASATFVHGDQELLTQALANLVENALHHTPPGTRIHVCLQDHGEEGTVLSVEDDGPGVAEAELSRLTDRFYRGQRSRTMPGNGLGLTLVNAVAELHASKLYLRAKSPGFGAAVLFPCDSRSQGPNYGVQSRDRSHANSTSLTRTSPVPKRQRLARESRLI